MKYTIVDYNDGYDDFESYEEDFSDDLHYERPVAKAKAKGKVKPKQQKPPPKPKPKPKIATPASKRADVPTPSDGPQSSLVPRDDSPAEWAGEPMTPGAAPVVSTCVIVGQVDSGKSTLIGRLLVDAQVVCERSFKKLEREAQAGGMASFQYAWVMDEGTEERSRGVTVDLTVKSMMHPFYAKKGYEPSAHVMQFIDTPGHLEFLPSMVAGASMASFAVVVVDSTDFDRTWGSAQCPAKDHLRILKWQGVPRFVIAINKLDMAKDHADAQYRFASIKERIQTFWEEALEGGKDAGDSIEFCPISGFKGINTVHRIDSSSPSALSWWEGPCLLELIWEQHEVSLPAAVPEGSPPRFAARVLDVSFSADVSESAEATIQILSNGIAPRDNLPITHYPRGKPGAMKPVQRYSRQDKGQTTLDAATAAPKGVEGEILTGVELVDLEAVKPGDIICDRYLPGGASVGGSLTVEAPEVTEIEINVLRGTSLYPGYLLEGYAGGRTVELLVTSVSGLDGKRKKSLAKGSKGRVSVTAHPATADPLIWIQSALACGERSRQIVFLKDMELTAYGKILGAKGPGEFIKYSFT